MPAKQQPCLNLTPVQLSVAQALREYRPPVLPGTNVIVSASKRVAWNNVVNACIKGLEFRPGAALREFCDVAGVPD